MEKLIIVESPTKASTIKNFLSKEYKVIASIGHIRDLATSGTGGYGVDIEADFKPTYSILKGKSKVINQIKYEAKNKEVLIATDPDREGEAIAWHLANILKLDMKKNLRVRFYEITKKAVNNAIVNPVPIDMNLVFSQETRRILDRIIGFDLSKLVQRKLRSTSAGRVQSAALKVIHEREVEIEKFVKKPYYLVFAEFDNFKADYILNSQNFNEKTKAIEVCEKAGKEFLVEKIDVVNQNKYSAFPYTTSKLQQDGVRRLKMGASFVMNVAQKLYEGIKIDGETIGLITYMRTDSTRLSDEFVNETKKYIEKKYGKEYVGKIRQAKSNKSSQEAHEAIRPTDINLTPEKVKPYLDNNGFKVYNIIYNTTLAYLMKAGLDEVKNVSFVASGYQFKTTFTKPLFLGYRILNNDESTASMPTFANQVGDKLISKKVYHEEKFTQPPSRFSEATLIADMEKAGVGRPSTYAEITKKIVDVGYVEKIKGYYVPTEQGKLTAINLEQYFKTFIDLNYTSKMEEKLDLIALGEGDKTETLKSFYTDFKPLIDYANANMAYQIIEREVEKVGEDCPECGKELVYRYSKKNEKFIACSGFSSKPRCKYTRSMKK